MAAGKRKPAKPASNRQIMTKQEAAEEIGVSISTIQRWMDKGDVYYIWVGGQRKLTRELWDHFLRSRTTTGPLQQADDEE